MIDVFGRTTISARDQEERRLRRRDQSRLLDLAAYGALNTSQHVTCIIRGSPHTKGDLSDRVVAGA